LQTASLIVNPNAGRGIARKHIAGIRTMLRGFGIETVLNQTHKEGDAVLLAERAKQEGFELVIAMGGDGTIHETVNGLARAAGAGVAGTLGIIPIGTGNDFVKMLNIPLGQEAACQRIAQGGLRRVDMGRVNDRFFVNNVGVGFDAQVAIEVLKVKWAPGNSKYIVALARNMLLSYRTPRVKIELDGEVFSREITLVTVGNGRCAGGRFWLTPAAEIDDGQFDVCIGQKMSKLQILALVPTVMNGSHVRDPKVQMARARRAVITSEEPLPVHADGEIIDTAAMHIEADVLPHKLQLIG
jgi:diacylglycerol kinase (ATP)